MHILNILLDEAERDVTRAVLPLEVIIIDPPSLIFGTETST